MDSREGKAMSKEQGLKPCPFCGGDGEVVHHNSNKDYDEWRIACKSRCCFTQWVRDIGTVISEWNTRAPLPCETCGEPCSYSPTSKEPSHE